MSDACPPITVVNATQPTPAQLQSFFGAAEDGPFVMVNLLKFKDKATYPDGREPDISGADAYLRYGMAVREHIERVGGKSGYAGRITGLMLGEVSAMWDMVALVEYPSLVALRDMVMHPQYQAIAVHREAGLAGQLNIKTRGALS